MASFGVVNGFLQLIQNAPRNALPIVQFFREFYIDGRRPHGRPRAQAMFPPAMWNVRQRTLDERPRRTNILEGYHNRLRTIIARHGAFYQFMRTLQKETAYIQTQIEKLETGQWMKPRKKADVEKDRRILAVTRSYNNRLWMISYVGSPITFPWDE